MWVLILMMHVGPMGSGNSNALTTANFETLELCTKAGEQAKALASATVKEIKFTCARAK